MAGTPHGAADFGALVAQHGSALHRLATMLTADTDMASTLTAQVLSAATPRDDSSSLRTALVRAYLRTAPRRPEGVLPNAPRDAADVLRGLRRTARAATVLRVGERLEVGAVARTLGVRPARVPALVPEVGDLDIALVGLADQLALTGPALATELEARRVPGGSPGAASVGRVGGARWRWVAAAAIPLALLGGYAAWLDREADTSATAGQDPGSGTLVGADAGALPDLTAQGWKLTGEGAPPTVAAGLRLRDSVTLDGERSADVPLRTPTTYANFGVLWCDMPPAQDDNLQVPSGVLTIDEHRIELPCAGTDGSPPVRQVVALPPSGLATLELRGDLPPQGSATLGVYTETEGSLMPISSAGAGEPPLPPAGGIALGADDVIEGSTAWAVPSRLAAAVEVGHDSELLVWAGTSGLFEIRVDGVVASDDGDLALEGPLSGESTDPDPDRWRSQEPDLRHGTWSAHAPGTRRAFALPDDVRPAPGERAVVVVEALDVSGASRGIPDLQVAVSDARAAQIDTSALEPVADPAAPEFILGHRLVAEYAVPSDGLARELRGAEGQGPLVAVGVLDQAIPEDVWMASEGLIDRGAGMEHLWFDVDEAYGLTVLRQPWFWGSMDPSSTSGTSGPETPVRALAPALAGRSEARVLLYTPVPYEEFDFAAAAVPADVFTPGDGAQAPYSGWMSVLTTLDEDDLEDGELVVPVTQGGELGAVVTTEGAGRLRFLLDDAPADYLGATDGWWSSWTDEHVASEVMLAYGESTSEQAAELRIVVEGYDEGFEIELRGSSG